MVGGVNRQRGAHLSFLPPPHQKVGRGRRQKFFLIVFYQLKWGHPISASLLYLVPQESDRQAGGLDFGVFLYRRLSSFLLFLNRFLLLRGHIHCGNMHFQKLVHGCKRWHMGHMRLNGRREGEDVKINGSSLTAACFSSNCKSIIHFFPYHLPLSVGQSASPSFES